MPVQWRDSKGVLHTINTTADDERELQANKTTIADLIATRGFLPDTTDPQKPLSVSTGGGAGRPAPDAVRQWLKYYPGLGTNGEPNQWAYLLQNTVNEGLRSGKLKIDQYRNIETGKVSQQALQKVLQRAQEGADDPWLEPGPQHVGSQDVLTALGQTNPLTLGLYGANAAMGTSFGESMGLTPPQGMNPFGPLPSGMEARVAPLRPAAGLAQSLPMGILGRLAGGAMGGATDAGIEATRQQASSGSVTSPGAVVAQGALGAAANIIPGLGWLGTGGRMARMAKTGLPMAAYGAASQGVSNYADQGAGVEPAASPWDALINTGLFGTLLGGLHGGQVTKGGTLRDKGLVGQVMDAKRAARPPAPGAPASAPPPAAPTAPPAGGAATPGPTDAARQTLLTINERLNELSRTGQYDTPEYGQLLAAARTAQAALDQPAAAPARDVRQLFDAAVEELSRPGVAPERAKQLQKRISKLAKQLGKPSATRQPEPVPAAQPGQMAAPPSETAPPISTPTGTTTVPPAPMMDQATLQAKLAELKAQGKLTKPEGGMTPEADALIMQALGATPTDGPTPVVPPATPKQPKVPLAPGQKRDRFATPFRTAEEFRTKAPDQYRKHVAWMDTLIKREGYAAAKQWIEAVANGRQAPGLKVSADKAGRAFLNTTQVLSKSPNHVKLLWDSLGPHYAQQAERVGQVDPTKAIKNLGKQMAGPGGITPDTKQTLKATAEQLGAAEVASNAPFIETPAQAAEQVAALKAQSKLGQQLAGWVPPQHKDNPLTVWPLAHLEDAARAMFSSKKKTIGQPTKPQILVAGSRLMERYEKQVALGKDPTEAAQAILELGKSGRLKEHRFHAQGQSKEKLQDWIGEGGGAVSLGPRLDAPERTSTGYASSLGKTTTDTETAFTMAEQDLVNRKVSRRQNMKGVEKGATATDVPGLIEKPTPPVEPTPGEPAGPTAKLGEKLLAATPLAFVPGDDEDDDTTTRYAKRLATLGLSAAAGATLWQRSRKAWRLGGKPAHNLDLGAPRLGQAIALVHDDIPRVIQLAEAYKKKFPAFADRIEVQAVNNEAGVRQGAALHVPTELEQDPTFVKAFSRSLELAEHKNVQEAKAQAPKKVPAAPTLSTEDAFAEAAHDLSQEPPPPDAEFGPSGNPDDAFGDAMADMGEPGGEPGAAQRPGWKPRAPIFALGEDGEVLDSGTPSAKRRLDNGTFQYDPRDDRRILLREARALNDYEKRLVKEAAAAGEVPIPNPPTTRWYDRYDPNNPNDELTRKLAQVRKDRPLAQATVIQNDKTGKYAIQVNEHGFMGPVVHMRRKDDQAIHTGHKPDAWAGYSPEYVAAVKAGEVKPHRQVTRVKGHDVLPYEVWAPSEGRTIEIPVEGEQGQGYKRQADKEGGQRRLPTVDVAPITGAGVKTQHIEVSDRPVAVLQTKNTAQLDKVAAALKRHFGADLPLLTQTLPNGDKVLTIERKAYDAFNRMDREIASEIPHAPDPDKYYYQPVAFGERPVGLGGGIGPGNLRPQGAGPKGFTERAPDVVPVPLEGGDALSASRVKAYQQAGRARSALELQLAKETDPVKQAALRKQIQHQKTLQYQVMNDRKNPAASGKLTWKEAAAAGFKTIETSANETRMAEIRQALQQEFGDDYVKHFVARGQMGAGRKLKWHIAVSPEFMEGASRLTYQRQAVARERQKLNTGAAPPAPRRQPLIRREGTRAPVAKDLVEFSSRSGVERGTVDKVSPDGKRVWVRMKDGRGLVPLDPEYVRVVESGGQVVNPPLPQLAAFQDNDLIRPLVSKLTGKADEQLTNADYEQAWQLLVGEADKTKRTSFETIEQAYKDQGVEPPAALKDAMRRLQPRGLTGASREIQDMAANVSVAPHDVVRDVLWNINGTPPTAGQIIKFTKHLDEQVDRLIAEGAIDRKDVPKGRLALLHRVAAQALSSENTHRAEQLKTTVHALEEALAGLPQHPFGERQPTRLPQASGETSTLPSSSSRPLPSSADQLAAEMLAPYDQSPHGQLRSIVDDLIEEKRAGRQFAEKKYGDFLSGQRPDAPAREPQLTGPLPPKHEIEVIRPTADQPLSPALVKDADLVVFYDRPLVGKATRGSKPALFQLPMGPMGKFGFGESSTMGYDVIPGKIPTIEPGPHTPSRLTDEWAAAKAAIKAVGRTIKHTLVLNPTPSQLQAKLQDFQRLTGRAERRQARIVVVGDDRGRVAFTQAAQRAGSAELFEAAIRDAKVSVGATPDAKLTPAQWEQALKKPENWRLLSILPAVAAGSVADAEASDGSEPNNGFRQYLPTLVALGLVAGGAMAYKRYRNRPVKPIPALGPTAIEALAARQKTQLAESLHQPPIELSVQKMKQKLQNSYVQLEDEQNKLDKQGLLRPEQKAMNVWQQTLGGGGGAVDAAMIRINKTLDLARKEGLHDALHNELNMRGMERMTDTLTGRVTDTENQIAALLTKARDINKQKRAATSTTAKLQLGKQASIVLKEVRKARRQLATHYRAVKDLHAGKKMPGGLTPAQVALDRVELQRRLGRSAGRVAQLAERIYQEPKQLMDAALKEGVISQALYDKVVSKEKGYVNLRKWFETVTTTRVGKMKSAFGGHATLDVTTDRIVQHLVGGPNDTLHPIKALSLFMRDAQRELSQQRATRSMVEMFRQDPALTGLVKRVRVDKQGIPIPKDHAWLTANNMRPVTYLVDGKPVHYAVPDWAAQLSEVAGQAAVNRDAFMKLLGRARGWSQASMTTLSAAFQIVNMRRDLGTAGQLLPEAYTRLSPTDYAKRYVDWGKAFTEVLRESPDWQQALQEGVGYSTYTKGLDPQMYQDLLDEHVLGSERPMRTVLRKVTDVTSAIENATKLMTWKRLRDKGMGTHERVALTRNFGGSPDFWLHGDWSQGLGTPLLFFNPAVQGISQSVKGLRKHGKYLIPAALGGAVLAHAWNTQPAFKNDKGELDLYDVDPNIRSNNWVILHPWLSEDENGRPQRRYWLIPKPHISQLLYTPIEAALEARERGTVDVPAMLNAVASKLLPFNASSFELERPTSLVEAAAGSIQPALRVPAEMLADRQLFGDRPIEGKAFEHTKKSERFRPSTGMLFRDLGKGVEKVQSLSGKPGEGWSPLMLEYAAKGTLPGPVDAISDAYDTVGGLLGRDVPRKPSGRIPLVSSVMRRFSGPQYEGYRINKARNDFYSALDQARKDQRIGGTTGLAPYAQYLEQQATQLAEWRQLRQVLQPKAQAGDAQARQALNNLLKGEEAILAASRRVLTQRAGAAR